MKIQKSILKSQFNYSWKKVFDNLLCSQTRAHQKSQFNYSWKKVFDKKLKEEVNKMKEESQFNYSWKKVFDINDIELVRETTFEVAIQLFVEKGL